MLKAFTAWLKLNPELAGLPDAALAGHPLVLLSLAALQSTDLFDDAVDATAELIYATGLMMHHAQPPSRYMPLVQELVHTVCLRLVCDCCVWQDANPSSLHAAMMGNLVDVHSAVDDDVPSC